MCQSVSVRLLVVALALAAPCPLFAQTDFFGRTVGSFTFTDAEPPVITGDIETFFIVFKGPVEFQFLTMSFEITRDDTPPDDMTGLFTFLGADPADSLSGIYEGVNFPNDDGIWTGGGSWTALTGTGAFEGLSGHGTFTTALFLDDGSAATAFDGVIIPAPGAALLLAGPAMAFFTARRRSR